MGASAIIILIVAVMVASGALGGLINYYLSSEHTLSVDSTSRLSIGRHLVIGVGAALIIPLFLNSISANLIDQIIGKRDSPQDLSKLLVLTGFCILAAITSRRFIDSLSAKLFSQVVENTKNIKDVSQKTDEAANKAEIAKLSASRAEQVVAPLVEDEASGQDENEVVRGAFSGVELTAEERAVLRASISARYSIRSLTGLSKDAGVAKDEVNRVITSLIDKGLLAQTINSAGLPRWYSTQKGRVAAEAP